MADETLGPVTIREAPRRGAGLWSWDCGGCCCAFGPLRSDRGQAEREGREHLAAKHGGRAGGGAYAQIVKMALSLKDGAA